MIPCSMREKHQARVTVNPGISQDVPNTEGEEFQEDNAVWDLGTSSELSELVSQ